jgi:hypothetical protein
VKRAEQAIGRPLTPHEIYLSHQQGSAGLAAHLKNPDQPAWKSMASTAEGQEKGEGWAKRAIWDNLTPEAQKKFGSVENVKSSDFVQFWKEEGGRKGIKDAAIAPMFKDAPVVNAPPSLSAKTDGKVAPIFKDAETPNGRSPARRWPRRQPPEDPYRKARPAHDLLDTKMTDLAAQRRPDMVEKARGMFGDKTLREAINMPVLGACKSQVMPELAANGIDPAEFERRSTHRVRHRRLR